MKNTYILCWVLNILKVILSHLLPFWATLTFVKNLEKFKSNRNRVRVRFCRFRFYQRKVYQTYQYLVTQSPKMVRIFVKNQINSRLSQILNKSAQVVRFSFILNYFDVVHPVEFNVSSALDILDWILFTAVNIVVTVEPGYFLRIVEKKSHATTVLHCIFVINRIKWYFSAKRELSQYNGNLFAAVILTL